MDPILASHEIFLTNLGPVCDVDVSASCLNL